MGAIRISFPDDYHPEDGVWVRNGDTRDLPYSDGDDVEERLARVVAEAHDLSVFSADLRPALRDPPLRYHLTPRRANLLRPFAAALTGRVLEVGAGCGAVTRYLGELGGRVTAVEGSRRRCAIARSRTRDLPNVAVVWDDANRFVTAEPFDAVVMVGVLEYARVFLGAGQDSPRLFLTHLRGLLREHGMLVLAIENQLGARYWAGGAEDHTGFDNFGIQDSYDEASVATFGRHELQEILRGAGLPHQRWYVPVPDYKMPLAVLSPAGLACNPRFDAAYVLARHAYHDERRPVHPRFSLERVWSALQRNRLLLEFANSFLVAAGPAEAFADRLGHGDRLAWSYAVDRHPAYANEACVCLEADGLMIRRRKLAPEAPAPETLLGWRLHDEPYAEGQNWWWRLVALLTRPGWTMADVATWAQWWLAAVLEAAGAERAPQARLDARLRLPGRLLDATPFNLVATHDGGRRFVNLEWEARGELELGFLVYRALGSSLWQQTSVSWTGAEPAPTPGAILARLFAELGLEVGADDVARYAQLEAHFQAWQAGLPAAAGVGPAVPAAPPAGPAARPAATGGKARRPPTR